MNKQAIAERIAAKMLAIGIRSPEGPEPKFQVGDKVKTHDPKLTEVFNVGDWDSYLDDRRYQVVDPVTRRKLWVNEKGMKKASGSVPRFDTAREFVTFLKRTLIPDLRASGTVETEKDFVKAVRLIETGRQDHSFIIFLRNTLILDLKESGTDATAEDFEEAIYWIDNGGIPAASIKASAGMDPALFHAKVRRIMQKIAFKYGGRASGQVASGTTEDGVVWSATIARTNASNGETFGQLCLTVDGNTVREYWSWDQVFERAGIPVVNAGIKIASSYPSNYFVRSGAKVKAEEYGLTDVENDDLTALGLISKLKEWQEQEGGVPAFVYLDIAHRMREYGVTMPSGIRRIASIGDGSAVDWAVNLAYNYVRGIGSDIKTQLMNAARDLDFNWSVVGHRLDRAGGNDLRTREGMYFILTGERYPSSRGYSGASSLDYAMADRVARSFLAVNKFTRNDIVWMEKNGQMVRTKIIDFDFNGGRGYTYTVDQADKPVSEAELSMRRPMAASTPRFDGKTSQEFSALWGWNH